MRITNGDSLLLFGSYRFHDISLLHMVDLLRKRSQRIKWISHDHYFNSTSYACIQQSRTAHPKNSLFLTWSSSSFEYYMSNVLLHRYYSNLSMYWSSVGFLVTLLWLGQGGKSETSGVRYFTVLHSYFSRTSLYFTGTSLVLHWYFTGTSLYFTRTSLVLQFVFYEVDKLSVFLSVYSPKWNNEIFSSYFTSQSPTIINVISKMRWIKTSYLVRDYIGKILVECMKCFSIEQ